MYERFSDRARKVMQLANQEATRFNHEWIGCEHILLGIVKEGGGVAAKVLTSLDVDLRKIRLEVEKIVQSGPDMVTMGKLPQTPRAKKVVEYAMEEAAGLHHNFIGSEHLLLGLIREEEGTAAAVLRNLGVKLEDVRSRIMDHYGTGEVATGPMASLSTMSAGELSVYEHLVAAYHGFVELQPLEADKSMFLTGLRTMMLAVSGQTLDRCWPEVWKNFGERR